MVHFSSPLFRFKRYKIFSKISLCPQSHGPSFVLKKLYLYIVRCSLVDETTYFRDSL